jgi:hypothetical protein
MKKGRAFLVLLGALVCIWAIAPVGLAVSGDLAVAGAYSEQLYLPMLMDNRSTSALTATPTRSATATPTPTAQPSTTWTRSPTAPATHTHTPMPTRTNTGTMTSPPTATMSPTPTATATSTRTVTSMPSPTHTLAPDDAWLITGMISHRGAPADGIAVHLGRYGEDLEPEIILTTTAESGLYRFGAPQVLLGAGDICGVIYRNREDVPRLAIWNSQPFEIDVGTPTYQGGDFDIAGVRLEEPSADEPLSFPVRFRWRARGPGRMPGESYQIEITNGVDQTFLSELIDGSEYVLAGLPPRLSFHEVYEWRILVWADGGYGASFDVYSVAFKP